MNKLIDEYLLAVTQEEQVIGETLNDPEKRTGATLFLFWEVQEQIGRLQELGQRLQKSTQSIYDEGREVKDEES